MNRKMISTAAGIGAAALLLAACSGGDGDNPGGDNDGETNGSGSSSVEAMRSWDACEVLGDVQPLSDFLGIEEWAGTGDPNKPTSAEWTKGWDAEALSCFGGIDLGSFQDLPATGEIRVHIVPMDNEDQAVTSFERRAASAELEADEEETGRIDLVGSWDQGFLIAKSSGATEYVNAVVQDGPWLLHVYITHSTDLGVRAGGDPDFQFTNDELHQWLSETYIPETYQSISDRLP